MTNSYYTPSGAPAAQSRGASGSIRSELTAIQTGFDQVSRQFGGTTASVLVSGVDGGVVNAYTVAPIAPVVAYAAKILVLFTPTISNVGASTLNVSGLGASALLRVDGSALVLGDLVAGVPYLAQYVGPAFQLLSVTKNYIDQLSFSSVLPAQPGTAVPLYLRTMNGVATWTSIGILRITRTSNVIVTNANAGNIIEVTSGTFTQTADTANFAAGFYYEQHNNGPGQVTITNADGQASYPMLPGEHRRLTWDGTMWRTDVLKPYQIALSAVFAHTQAPGYAFNDILLVGGGGGGGSGCRGGASSFRPGGPCGGSPSTRRLRVPVAAVGTITTLTPGSAGTGGAAVTTASNANGNAGTAGGNTTYGTITAYGGCAGAVALTGNSFVQTSGSGSLGAGVSAVGGTNTATKPGGAPGITPITGYDSTVVNDAFSQEGGAGCGPLTSAGGNSIYGGASAGNVDVSSASAVSAGSSQFGVGAATHGGWITDSNTLPTKAANAGKTGGWNLSGAIGGTCGPVPTAGANGAANAGGIYDVGNPGAGGGSTATAGVNAGKGGDGSFPGGPGGGGGAGSTGTGNTGPGGVGAAGYGVITGVPG